MKTLWMRTLAGAIALGAAPTSFAQAASNQSPAAIGASSTGNTPTGGIDLHMAYEAAALKTETLGIQDQRTQQADAYLSQARGGLFPNLAFNASYVRQDSADAFASPSNTVTNAGGTTGPTYTTSPSAASNPNQWNARLTLTQPIFRGFREFAGLRSATRLLESQRATSEQARLTLYASVAQAFFDVQIAEADLVDLNGLLDLTRKRVQELSARVRIGRSREAEVLTAQTQAINLEAQIELGKNQLTQVRQNFQFVTGLPSTTPLEHDASPLPQKLPQLKSYLDAGDARPDLKAARLLTESADADVSVARGGHLPSLDFEANYYLKRTVAGDNKWDLGLALTFPIFQGGIVLAQTRKAAARHEELDLSYSQSRRQVALNLESLYNSFQSELEQLRLLDQAVKVADRNYQLETRDYRYGLVTNIDVLQALDSLYQTKRTLDRTQYQARAAWVALETGAGRIPGAPTRNWGTN